MAAPRNYDGIKFEALRRRLDPLFASLHDSLEVAYYDNWRHGTKYNWNGFNAQATPEDSKLQFDHLHILLFNLYVLAFNSANKQDPAGGIPDSEWRMPAPADNSADPTEINRGVDRAERAFNAVSSAPTVSPFVDETSIRALKGVIVREGRKALGYDLDLDAF